MLTRKTTHTPFLKKQSPVTDGVPSLDWHSQKQLHQFSGQHPRDIFRMWIKGINLWWHKQNTILPLEFDLQITKMLNENLIFVWLDKKIWKQWLVMKILFTYSLILLVFWLLFKNVPICFNDSLTLCISYATKHMHIFCIYTLCISYATNFPSKFRFYVLHVM